MKIKYYKLTDSDLERRIKTDFQEQRGTYILHFYKNGEPAKICRFRDNDLNGILYIGKTDDTLYNRVTSLATAIKSNSDKSQVEPKQRGHRSLSLKFFRIRKHIELEDLIVEVRETAETPEIDESKLLESYVATFGELPPLNGNYGKYADWSLF
jgi:hypothetical protein